MFEPGTVQVQRFEVSWNDGTRTSSTAGETRIYLRQLTWEQLLATKWRWFLTICSVFVIFIGGLKTFIPRPLRGRLQVSQDGLVVANIDMPKQHRSKSVIIRVTSSPVPSGSTKSLIFLAGKVDEEIATLISQRYNGRWTTVVKPGPMGVETSNGLIFRVTDLRKIAHRSVFSADRRIEITFR
jgi:hypothetical protein